MKGGRPTLEADRAEKVRTGLRGLLIDQYDGNTTKLARALRRSQSAVSQLLAGKNAPSYETAERVAALMGQTVAQLFGQEPASTELGAAPANMPNLREALGYVREKGRVTDRSINAVCAAARFLPDLDAEAWIALLVQVERHQPVELAGVIEGKKKERRSKVAGA